ncbi:integral membrane sensor signal transduction histidine kinase [Candidatus Magnetobacterium bavaricum]|uniref:histidine kinase n=1 Tax=Candidatus Magnetobacterium bavaricum TaxID=29290 RepID=A0A0F3GIW3_9BACT|nr:integral membrane sensor signal transduction histidine kinase [Candidatus Magnetobacterium bavaricum]
MNIVRSIKGRLFLWLLCFTSGLIIAISAFLYHQAREIILQSIDETLHSKLQIIIGLLHEEHGTIELELSEVITGEYSIPRSGHYYEVIMGGNTLAASPSLVGYNFDLTSTTIERHDKRRNNIVYMSAGPGGEPIRVLQHDMVFLKDDFRVFIAEDISSQLTMIRTFRNILFAVIPAGIAFICVTGILIARASLMPINDFSSKLSKITHKTLSRRLDTDKEVVELAGLAGSFNAMLDRLQCVFESEKRLISDASHGLKTPIAVIKVHCEVLCQRRRSAQEYEEALETIKAIADGMERLVRNLLSLARLDSGILSVADFKPLRLNDCIESAIQIAMPTAKDKNIDIQNFMTTEVSIMADRDRLTEALLNLITNAILYNKHNGLVELSCIVQDGLAKLFIKDTGIGIKNSDLQDIFKRFYRCNNHTDADGNGLGLSIAELIIKAHGGHIGVDSELNRGSCFTVVLPVPQAFVSFT